jgi:hypothetical protein
MGVKGQCELGVNWVQGVLGMGLGIEGSASFV